MHDTRRNDVTGGPGVARHVAPTRRWFVAAAIAFTGALETAWLTLSWLQHGHVPCTAGTRLDCESLFLAAGTAPLGLPLPVWGHAAYAACTLLALAAGLLAGRSAVRAAGAFSALAGGMALYSVFLMVRMLTLGALCPWCVLSAALSLALGTLALAGVVRGECSWRPLALAPLFAGALLALTLVRAPAPVAAAGDARARAVLARHLRASGARFYGVWWCVACREQKELFGAAAGDLPYVECSRDSAPPQVREFPSWVIAGRVLRGVQPLDTLAVRSGLLRH